MKGTRAERGDTTIMRAQATQRPLIPGLAPAGVDVSAGNWPERLTARILGMRRKAATIVLIVLSASLGAYAIFGHDGLAAYHSKQQRSAELQRQIVATQKENQRLTLHDQRLQGDRDTIEYEAREQMHYTRPGEVIYTLPQAPGASTHR